MLPKTIRHPSCSLFFILPYAKTFTLIGSPFLSNFPQGFSDWLGLKEWLPQDENEVSSKDIRKVARLRHCGKLIDLNRKEDFYQSETTQPSSLFFETKSKTDIKLDRQQESQDIPNDNGKFYKPREIPAATRYDREK